MLHKLLVVHLYAHGQAAGAHVRICRDANSSSAAMYRTHMGPSNLRRVRQREALGGCGGVSVGITLNCRSQLNMASLALAWTTGVRTDPG